MNIAFEAPLGNTGLALNMSSHIFAIAPNLRNPFYAEAVRNSNRRLILDNGAYEGRLADLSEFLELCLEWKPDVAVIPDVIGDCDKTVELGKEFFARLSNLGDKRPFEVMVVLQGRDDGEKEVCHRALVDYGIDIVGLGLGSFLKDWRGRFGYYARHVESLPRVHVLGIANVHDLCLWEDIAESVDTSLPFHLAQEGKDLRGHKRTKHLNWDSTLSGRQLELALANIAEMREALANV